MMLLRLDGQVFPGDENRKIIISWTERKYKIIMKM